MIVVFYNDSKSKLTIIIINYSKKKIYKGYLHKTRRFKGSFIIFHSLGEIFWIMTEVQRNFYVF